MEHNDFPDRLRAAIVAGGLTIEKTAELAGLSTNTVQFYLSGRRKSPSGESALNLCEVFGFSVGWLLRGEGDCPDDASIRAAADAARLRGPRAAATPDEAA